MKPYLRLDLLKDVELLFLSIAFVDIKNTESLKYRKNVKKIIFLVIYKIHFYLSSMILSIKYLYEVQLQKYNINPKIHTVDLSKQVICS